MTFQEYYRSLSPSERITYCSNIELNQRYVELHLLNVQRRNPRETTMERMANFSAGNLSYQDVISSFPKIIHSEHTHIPNNEPSPPTPELCQ